MFKTIPGHERYEASDDGTIRMRGYQITFHNGDTKDIPPADLHQTLGNGYYHVWIDGVQETVHRLVAMTFIPNPNNLPFVVHKDGNKQNNNVKNLEWNIVRNSAKSKRRGDPVICIEDNIVFDSIKMASEFYGISYSKMAYAINQENQLNGKTIMRVSKYKAQYIESQKNSNKE